MCSSNASDETGSFRLLTLASVVQPRRVADSLYMTVRVTSLVSGGLLLLGMALLGGTRGGITPSAVATTADVSILAGGFSPATITVDVGTTVTWTNNSTTPQTATAQIPGPDPNFFSSGWIYAGNSYSRTFTVAGTVPYKSLTTGLLGTIIVSGGGATPTNTPPGGGGGGGNSVAIEAGGFSPATLAVNVGDTVTWTNNSSAPQTATAQIPGPDPNFFSSGWIYTGNSFSRTFTVAGTVPYKSLTTGLTGTIIIGGGGATPTPAPANSPTATPTPPPGSTPTNTPTPAPGATSTPTPQPGATSTPTPSGGSSATPTPTRTPAPAPTATATPSTNNVSITSSGFSPQSITVSQGTTVTWTNNTKTPQTVNHVTAKFLSGFVFAGKSWSFTFATEGVFQYKSVTGGFAGTVTVNSGGGGGSSLPFSPMGPGWNLVTYGGGAGDTAQALSQLGTDWTAAYHWDGLKWRRFFRPGIAPAFLNTLTTLTPGQPLWILATTAIP